MALLGGRDLVEFEPHSIARPGASAQAPPSGRRGRCCSCPSHPACPGRPGGSGRAPQPWYLSWRGQRGIPEQYAEPNPSPRQSVVRWHLPRSAVIGRRRLFSEPRTKQRSCDLPCCGDRQLRRLNQVVGAHRRSAAFTPWGEFLRFVAHDGTPESGSIRRRCQAEPRREEPGRGEGSTSDQAACSPLLNAASLISRSPFR